jgi:hypothetical protein
MRARNERFRRALRGRFFLRDLAGLADVERLLASHVIREQFSPDVADNHAPADANASAPQPQPEGSLRWPR